MNKSCHTYQCVMSHIWMRHVTHMNESCHTYESVKSHTWMSHVTLTQCHTHTQHLSQMWALPTQPLSQFVLKMSWVMSHAWMSHVTLTPCHTHAQHRNQMWAPSTQPLSEFWYYTLTRHQLQFPRTPPLLPTPLPTLWSYLCHDLAQWPTQIQFLPKHYSTTICQWLSLQRKKSVSQDILCTYCVTGCVVTKKVSASVCAPNIWSILVTRFFF